MSAQADSVLDDIRRLAWSGAFEQARSRYVDALAAFRASGAVPQPWLDLGCELGLIDVVDTLQAAAGVDRDELALGPHPELLHRAGQHHAGQSYAGQQHPEPAPDAAQAALFATPDGDDPPDGLETPGRTRPPESDTLAWRLLDRFAGRQDVWARQWRDQQGRTGYVPVREAVTADVLQAHVDGVHTVGIYPLVDGTVRWFVIDVDVDADVLRRASRDAGVQREAAQRLGAFVRAISHAAAEAGLPLLLEDSGYKGRHLWGLLAGPVDAGLVRDALQALMKRVAAHEPWCSVELFPKQVRVRDGGLGNLVKVPLGVHQRTGRRSVFLDEGGATLDALTTLQRHPNVPVERLRELAGAGRGAGVRSSAAGIGGAGSAGSAGTAGGGAGGGAERARRVDGADASGGRGGVREAELVRSTRRPGDDAPDTLLEDEVMFAGVISGCAVVHTLVARARRTGSLDADQLSVLTHTLGHLTLGPPFLRELLSGCAGVPPWSLPGRPLRGSPIACATVRRRVPEVAMGVRCGTCRFGQVASYDTPVLHAQLALLALGGDTAA